MASRSAKMKGTIKSGMSRGVAPSGGKASPGIPGIAVQKEGAKGPHGFKDGGMVAGAPMKARLDKPMRRASGGSVTMRGRSPYSSAKSASAPMGVAQDKN